MGNNNNKPKKRPMKLPDPRTIDDLPVEIIYKILDQLDIYTIFTSLYRVCKRFDEILLSYGKYHLNFEKLSLKELKLVCSRIHPEQVTDLTLSDGEHCSGFLEIFLSKFSIETFTYLRSLTLKQINDEEIMNKILLIIADHRSLPNCSSLKILNSDECYDDLFVEIIMSVLTKPSLQNIHFDLSYCRTTSNPLPWIEQSSIRHLTFIGSCTVNFIRNTFICVSNLECLTVGDIDADDEVDLNHVSHSLDDSEFEFDEYFPERHDDQSMRKIRFESMDTPNTLKSLIINTCSISMSKLEWLLEEMSNLKYLRLTTMNGYDDPMILDGERWERILINIERFQFLFIINLSSEKNFDLNLCLMKFQTHFWIEGKQWFIAFEKYDDDLIVYSLPYSHRIFMIKTNFTSFEYRSNVPEDLQDKFQSMKSVKELYIDASDLKKSPFENLPSPRFTHVTHLNLYGKWSRSKTFFDDLQTHVDLNPIEEFIREDSIPTKEFDRLLSLMPNLQSIKTTTNLINPLNAKRFICEKTLRSLFIEGNSYLEQSQINIEPFCEMFPRIEHLIIPVNSVDDCNYLMDNLGQHLRSVLFQIPPEPIRYDDTDDEDDDDDLQENEDNSNNDPFNEWMKELPNRYSCQRKQQQIHIWLK